MYRATLHIGQGGDADWNATPVPGTALVLVLAGGSPCMAPFKTFVVMAFPWRLLLSSATPQANKWWSSVPSDLTCKPEACFKATVIASNVSCTTAYLPGLPHLLPREVHGEERTWSLSARTGLRSLASKA